MCRAERGTLDGYDHHDTSAYRNREPQDSSYYERRPPWPWNSLASARNAGPLSRARTLPMMLDTLPSVPVSLTLASSLSPLSCGRGRGSRRHPPWAARRRLRLVHVPAIAHAFCGDQPAFNSRT